MNREQRRKVKAQGVPPKIVNFPDDSAPEEGAYIFKFEIELIMDPVSIVAYLPWVSRFHKQITDGGLKSPVCYCCEKEFDTKIAPPIMALWEKVTVPNSAADPRRFAQARKYVPPIQHAFIAVCWTCCPNITNAVAMLRDRTVRDLTKSGVHRSDHHAARMMHAPGRA
jgi:hypothetical protein